MPYSNVSFSALNVALSGNNFDPTGDQSISSSVDVVKDSLGNALYSKFVASNADKYLLLRAAVNSGFNQKLIINFDVNLGSGFDSKIDFALVADLGALPNNYTSGFVANGIYATGSNGTGDNLSPSTTDLYLSQQNSSELKILDSAIAKTTVTNGSSTDTYVDIIINFANLYNKLQDNTTADGNSRVVLNPLVGLNENTPLRFSVTSSTNLNNVNKDISGTSTNDLNAAWSSYLSSPATFSNLVAGTPSITSIPENSNGGINAVEAANGTDVVVSLVGTNAVAGNILTLNWGTQPTISRTLTTTDISNGSVTIAVPQTTIVNQGNGTFNVTAKIGSGASSVPFPATVDLIAPVAPTIGTIALDNIISKSEAEAQAGVVLSGTTEAGTAVSLVVGGQTRTAVVTGTSWSYTLTAQDITTLGQGTGKTVGITATDTAGNTTNITSQPFAIDTIAPVAPTIGAIALDNIISKSEAEAQAGVVLSGTTEAGTAVSLVVGGQTRTAVVTGTSWSYTLTAQDITTLGQGTGKTVGITATDTAGNTTNITSQPFAIDTIAPTAPTIGAIALNNVIDATEAGTGVVLTGTTESGTAVSLAIGGQTRTATVVNGSWSYALTAQDLTNLGQGTGKTVGVTATDTAGNTTNITSQAFAIDTIAPTAPTIGTIAGNDIISKSEAEAQAGVILSGTTELGTAVSLVVGGQTRTATVDGTTWSYTLTAQDLTNLGQGTGKTVGVTATDTAGNTTNITSQAFAIDTIAPTAPTIGTIALNDSIDATEASAGVVLSGTTEAETVVSLTIGGETRTATVDGTTWSYTLTAQDITNLGQGTAKTVEVRATDATGNSTSKTSQQFEVDTKISGAPSITSILENSNGGINASEAANGTDVVISLAGTNAVAGNTLTLNWGTQPAILHPLTAEDINRGSVTLAVTKETIAAQNNTTFDVTAKIGAGASSFPFSVTVDLTAPTAPTIGAIALNDVIDVTEAGAGVVLSGTTELGTAVSLVVGGQTRTATVDGTSWSYTLTAEDITNLGQGEEKTVGITATDGVGNTTAITSQFFVIDTIAPTAPTIGAIALNDVIDVTEAGAGVVLSGTTESGAAVSLSIGGQTRTATVVDGNWSYTLTAQDLTNLGQGTGKTVGVTATDTAGNTTNITSQAFAIDTIAPTAPTIGTIASNNIIDKSEAEAQAGVVLSGTTEAGAAVSLSIGGETRTATVVNGNWSYTLTAEDITNLGQGTGKTVNVTATDGSGNTAAITSQAFAIDTIAPTAPTIGAIALDNIIDATEAGNEVILSGTTEAGTAVSLTIGGQTRTATVVDGNWSYTLTNQDLTNLGQGAGKTIDITATDAAGNSTGKTSQQFAIDTRIPNTPTITSILENSNGGINASEAENGTDVVIGLVGSNAVAGDVLSLTWGTQPNILHTLTAEDIDNGTVTITVTKETIAAQNNTTFDVTAKIGAGASSFPFSATVDLTAPTAPTIGAIALNDVIDVTEAGAGVVLSGTTESGAAVSLVVGGQTRTAVVVNGSWSYTLTAEDITNLGQGTGKTVGITATDATGNSTGITSQPFAIDTIAPTAPTIGTIALDNIISKNEAEAQAGVVLSGTTESGAAVSLVVGGQTRTATVDGTSWSYTLTAEDLTNLGQGTGKTVEVTATDATGNNTSTTSQPFAIDTIAPTAPTIGAIASNNIIDKSEAEAQAGVVLSGTTEAGTTVRLSIGGQTRTATVVDGNWSYTLTAQDLTNLGQGTGKTVGVTATDTAGNTTNITSQAFAIDTIAPTAPTIGAIASNNIIDKSEAEAQAGVVLTGTTESGAAVSLVVGGQTRTAIVDGTSWSYTLTAEDLTNLGQGTGKTVEVTATDATGNNTSTTSQPFAIDTIAPTAPTIGTIASNNIIDATEAGAGVALTGTTEAGTAVSLVIGGQTRTATVVDGNWSYTLTNQDITNLGQGTNKTIDITATDAAGNSTGKTSQQFAIDTRIPNTPNITSITENNNGGINASEAENGTDVVISLADTNAVTGDVLSLTWGTQPNILHTLTAEDIDNGTVTITVTKETIAAQNNTTFDVTAKIGAGASSFPFSVTVDLTAPTAPTIGTIALNDIISKSEAEAQAGVVLSGTTESGSAVSLAIGGQTRTAVVVNGSWSYTLTAEDITNLGQGTGKTVGITATDATGNSTGITSQPFAIDTIAPTAPTIGTIATDDIINTTEAENEVILSGTTEAGTTVSLSIGGQTRTATVNGTSWSYTLTDADLTDLGEGTGKTVNVIATDAAGNSADITSQQFTIDTTAPTIQSATLNGSTLTLTYDEALNAASSPLAGVYRVNVKDKGRVDVSQVNITGKTVTLTLSNSVKFGDEVTIDYTPGASPIEDGAGNDGDSLTGQSVNNTTPSIPDTTSPVVKTLTASPLTLSDSTVGSGKFTLTVVYSEAMNPSIAPTLSFPTPTENPGSTLSFASGSWTNTTTYVATFNVADVNTTLPNVDVRVTGAKDTSGNAQTQFDLANVFSIDTTNPSLALTTTAGDTVNNPFVVTATFSKPVNGFTAEDINIVNGSVTAPVSNDGGKTYTFTVTPTVDGVLSINVGADVAQDQVGNRNSAAPASLSRTVDRTAPATPSIPDLSDASDTGISNKDNLTSDNTPSFTGTAEAGSMVKLFNGNTVLGTTIATPAGTWSFTPTTALADGTYNITAQAIDAIGNSSPLSGALALTIDTTAPQVTFIPQVTQNGQPQLTGTIDDPTAIVQVQINGETYTATNKGDGTWTLPANSLKTPLRDGQYNVIVKAIDPAGSTSTDSTAGGNNGNNGTPGIGSNQSLVVDTAPPVGAIDFGSVPSEDNPNGSIAIKFDAPVKNFDLSDLVLTRDGVPISLNGAVLSTTDGITWTLSNLGTEATLPGNYELSLLPSTDVTDLAGNALPGLPQGGWQVAECQLGIPTAAISYKGGKRGMRYGGGGGSNRKTGGRDKDVLKGGGGNDFLRGRGGHDRINGGNGKDKEVGGTGNDRLFGKGGKDKLRGSAGRDWVDGGTRKDQLTGQLGDDILIGGKGKDILSGGRDRDMFVYRSLKEGGDRIKDFETQKDLLDLRKIFAGQDFAGGRSHAIHDQIIQKVQVGANTEIRVDTDGIKPGTNFVTLATLQNVNATTVTCSNFVL